MNNTYWLWTYSIMLFFQFIVFIIIISIVVLIIFTVIIFAIFVYFIFYFYQYNYNYIDSNSSLSSRNFKFNQDFFSTAAMYAFVILFIVAINSEGVKLFFFGLVIITNVYQVNNNIYDYYCSCLILSIFLHHICTFVTDLHLFLFSFIIFIITIISNR